MPYGPYYLGVDDEGRIMVSVDEDFIDWLFECGLLGEWLETHVWVC